MVAVAQPVKSTHAAAGDLLQIFPNIDRDNNFSRNFSVLGSDVLAGVPVDDTDAPNSGAVYQFDGTTGQLVHRFQNPTPESNDAFGFSVMGSGDQVLISAANDRIAGAAYLFDRQGDLLQTWENPIPDRVFKFGQTLAATDRSIYIGAPFSLFGGAVFRFDRATGELLHTFRNPNQAPFDAFGGSIAALEDRVLIGAGQDNTAAQNAGAAYLFDDQGNLIKSIFDPTPEDNEFFGENTAVVGQNLLVSAYLDNTVAPDSGSGYLFDTEGNLVHAFRNPTTGRGFGRHLGELDNNILMGDTDRTYLFRGESPFELLQTYKKGGPVAAFDGHVLIGDTNAVFFYEGLSNSTHFVRQPGDSNQDRAFDSADVVRVVAGGKFETGERANWSEGDWNSAPNQSLRSGPPPGDGLFNSLDVVAALASGLYESGPYIEPPTARLYTDRQTWEELTESFDIEDFEMTPIQTVSQAGGEIVTSKLRLVIDENHGAIEIVDLGLVNRSREFQGDLHGPHNSAGEKPEFNTIVFSEPVTAFGVRLASVSDNSNFPIRATLLGRTYPIQEDSEFFGVISDIPFSEVKLTADPISGNGFLYRIDDISFGVFGGAAVVVPEPAEAVGVLWILIAAAGAARARLARLKVRAG